MLNIKIICIGKLKEAFFADAAAEYIKRLGGYCRLELDELPEIRLPADPSEAEKDNALLREAERIIPRIPKDAVVIAMCVEGKEIDSPQFSEFLNGCAVNGKNKLCFLIGGSFGLHEEIKKQAALRMSMSKLTFPHHLARIMLLEQLYRAFKIAEGSKYHK
jgi:23S rRNA (pseudouridine1915-N3)-methyltransferase